ncbi:MAG TPA: carboxypeptidase regulatory-like domain-containing protein [Candidatus Polarisedimenticolia bacterium]|nr:carboxypeptidase regulatory-like domain-containing protein [Candidatus Polarisedimenticolia bacterium]
MRTRCNLAVVLSAVVLLCCGALMLNQNVRAAGEGKISGTVKLDGTAPHMRGIDMSKDPYCSKIHASDPAKMETVVAGSGGGLEHVVLYISEGLTGGALTQVPTEEPVFDQKGCVYSPHVLGLDVNQKFKVTTSDQTAHNIHPNPNPMTGNIPWNQSQPPGAPPVEKSWKATEMIPVQCNIHPWMHGWFAVVKGPYATTDASGAYTINNVPPGSYTVTAWQEDLGTQTQKVTVAAGAAGSANFSFKAK